MSRPTGEFFGPLDSWPTQEMEKSRKLGVGMAVAQAIEGDPVYPDDDHMARINLQTVIAATRDGSNS